MRRNAIGQAPPTLGSGEKAQRQRQESTKTKD
jgi:hypothetical protein